jgi:hypothetical protein
MADDRTFFEIAAALLPALMLGGLFSDQLKPGPGHDRDRRWPFLVIAFVGPAFVFAETVALSAAITGDPGSFDRVVVSSALIVAAMGTVVLALLPWVERLPPKLRRQTALGFAVLLVGTVVFAVLTLDTAIETASVIESTEELLAAEEERDDRAQRILAELGTVTARHARAGREYLRLTVRRLDLVTRQPRPSDYRARLNFLNGQIRFVRGEIEAYAEQVARLAKDAARLYETPPTTFP